MVRPPKARYHFQMCGRFDQNDIHRALAGFAWGRAIVNRSEAAPAYNAAPNTRRPLLHIQGEQLLLEDRHWGYQAAWAAGKVPMAINARLEKVENRYWRHLLKTGRAVVPVNGWYEWTGEKPHKQPWHIHRADGELIYMAALACFDAPGEQPAATGFAIVTADAQGGMVDVHDRRPIVFSAADAATWMDPELSGEQAAALARSTSLGADQFAWFKVGKAVGNVRNEGPQLAQELRDEQQQQQQQGQTRELW